MQDGNLHDLQYCWDCNISVVFPTSGLNSTNIIDYIEKCFKRKLARIKFSVKNSVEADIYLLPGVELGGGAPNIFYVLELKSTFFLGLKASKIIDCIEKCFKQKLYKIQFETKKNHCRSNMVHIRTHPSLDCCLDM